MRWRGATTTSLAVIASMVSGCYVGTEKRTVSRVVSVERSPLVVGTVGGVFVRGEITETRVAIQTLRRRDCHHRVGRVIEETSRRVSKIKTTTADLSGANIDNGDAGGAIALLALFPIVFAVTGVVSSVRVVASGTRTTRTPEPGEIKRFACPAEAPGLHVEVSLPSGAIVAGTTDAVGRFSFTIPETEPPSGTITVRALEPPASTTTAENERADDPRLEPVTTLTYAR